jgi:hypothetical protein
MLTSSTIALSVALILATASAAVAAPKQAVRHNTAMPVNQSLGAGQSCDMLRYMIKFEGDPEITITAAQRRAAYVACYGKPPPKNVSGAAPE